MGIEQFRYDGKRAVIVGGATGMGAAATALLADSAPSSWCSTCRTSLTT